MCITRATQLPASSLEGPASLWPRDMPRLDNTFRVIAHASLLRCRLKRHAPRVVLPPTVLDVHDVAEDAGHDLHHRDLVAISKTPVTQCEAAVVGLTLET